MNKIGRLLRKHIRTRYLVSLTNDEGFEGVVVDADAVHIVLDDASALAPNGDRAKVDGRLWIPRTNVKYMLEISAVAAP